jgi:hypothetical protein
MQESLCRLTGREDVTIMVVEILENLKNIPPERKLRAASQFSNESEGIRIEY